MGLTLQPGLQPGGTLAGGAQPAPARTGVPRSGQRQLRSSRRSANPAAFLFHERKETLSRAAGKSARGAGTAAALSAPCVPPSTRVPGISLRAGIALPKAAPWAPALLPAGVGEACPPGTRSDEEARGGLSAGRRGQGPLARARARLPGVGQGGGGPRRGLRRLSAKGIKGRRLAVPRWESVSPRPQPREGHGFGGLRALTPALRPRAHSGRTALVGRGLRRTGEVREQPGLPVAGHCHFLQGVQRIRG